MVTRILLLIIVAVFAAPAFADGYDIPWGLDAPPVKTTKPATTTVAYDEVLKRVTAGDAVAIFVDMPVERERLPRDIVVNAFARCDDALGRICGDGSKITKGMWVCFRQEGKAVLVQRYAPQVTTVVTNAPQWSSAWQTTTTTTSAQTVTTTTVTPGETVTTYYTTQPSRFGLFRQQSTCVGGNCPR